MLNEYGIWWRTCLCGHELPASFLLGRGRLSSQCAVCHHLMEREHSVTRQHCVAIVRGPSVGKSVYLLSIVRTLLGERLQKWGMTGAIVTERNAEDFERAAAHVDAGRVPDKTQDGVPTAFNLVLERRSRRRLLYLYDPAGVAYHNVDGLIEHRCIGYVTGIILLVDPFQIEEVRLQYADALEVSRGGLRPSPGALESTLARVLLALEQHYGLGTSGRVSWPVAVVLGKTDASGLKERLVPPAFGPGVKDRVATTSDAIRRQLNDWGETAFIHQLDERLSRVRCFTCSALGRLAEALDAAPFAPRRVVEPLSWILRLADGGFRFGGPRRASTESAAMTRRHSAAEESPAGARRRPERRLR